MCRGLAQKRLRVFIVFADRLIAYTSANIHLSHLGEMEKAMTGSDCVHNSRQVCEFASRETSPSEVICYTCVNIYIYTHICVYVCIYIYTCIHTYLYMYMYTYMCIHIYIYIYAHTYTYTYACVCIYIYIYICIP